MRGTLAAAAAAAADPGMLTQQLLAGVDYEIKRGCPNAKGKSFDDFQEFIDEYLRQLEAAVPKGGMLAQNIGVIRAEAAQYGGMDGQSRDALLRRLGSILVQAQRQVQYAQQQTPSPAAPPSPPLPHQQQQPTGAGQPLAWQPPRRSVPPGGGGDGAAAPRQPPTPTHAPSRRNPVESPASAPPPHTPPTSQSSRPAPRPTPPPTPKVKGRAHGRVNSLEEMPVVIAFDLETTGLSKQQNRIIELAAVNVSDPEHPPMSTLINPGRVPIPNNVVALTGITNSMVSAPAVPSFARAAELLEAFVETARKRSGGRPVLLAAHNARQFDAGFLQAEYRRLGRELPDYWRFVDTLPMARRRLDKSAVGKYSLESLAGYFGVGVRDGESAHRAGADARMLGDILQGILGVSFEELRPGDAPRAEERARAAAETLAEFSFSLGDPSKGSLRRAAAVTGGGSGSGGRAGRDTSAGFGATPIVSSTGRNSDVASTAAASAIELGDVQLDELSLAGDSEDEEEEDVFSRTVFNADALDGHAQTNGDAPARKPFWVAADPINGFVPETMDFARMVEADEAVASSVPGSGGETGAGAGAGHPGGAAASVDAEVAALHGRLRRDTSAWEEVDVKALQAHGVTAGTIKKLRNEGVETVSQVLRCYPRKYEEYARWAPGMVTGTNVLVMGKVVSWLRAPFTRGRGGFGGKSPSKLVLEMEDADGGIHPFEVKVWEYVPKDIDETLVPGGFACVRGCVSGRTSAGNLTLERTSVCAPGSVDPRAEVLVVPTYPKKGEMAPEKWPDVQAAALTVLKETLPADPLTVALGLESTVLRALSLVSHVQAMEHIHGPEGIDQVFAARERLAFEELLLVQTKFLQERMRALKKSGEGVSIVSTALCDELRSVLDFSLTNGQETALEEILHDMAGDSAMLRLLQGDVGCGKTVVAALAILAAIGNGHQGALMAPTEVLARQHEKTLADLFAGLAEPPVVVLLTGGMTKKQRDAALASIADGTADVIVGTHSLISDDVEFKSLGLAVVDEQHKFGVEQRARLMAKGPVGGYARRDGRDAMEAAAAAAEKDGDAADAAAWAAAAKGAAYSAEETGGDGDEMIPWRHAPHMLGMSATPIPRTVVMCKYGEMALSSIDEKPAGREPIETRVLTKKHHAAAYEKLVEEVSQGFQAFVVFALVNESDAESMERFKSAVQQFETLQEKYPTVRFGLLHGQLSPEEKAAALESFSSGETQVLVTTTVVEVGVDVPNASLMIIEDVERHGLAQLHQMRGRVGRGPRKSHCYLLISDECNGYQSAERLRVLEQTNNGFRIAENDLRQRGPGEYFGKKQSGTPISGLFHASVETDIALLDQARKAAAETIARSNVRGEGLPAPLAIALRGLDCSVDLQV